MDTKHLLTLESSSYERGLLEDATSGGGIRAVLDASQVNNFCIACRAQSPQLIASLLDERLSSDTWQVVQKTLVVIASLANAPGCEAHRDYLAEHCDTVLEVLETTKRASVRQQAEKVRVL